jgi:hypothetical protein
MVNEGGRQTLPPLLYLIIAVLKDIGDFLTLLIGEEINNLTQLNQIVGF